MTILSILFSLNFRSLFGVQNPQGGWVRSVVAFVYHSVYLTTTPLLLALFVLFLVKSCVDKKFRTWMLGQKLTSALVQASMTHCLILGIFPVTTPRPQFKMDSVTVYRPYQPICWTIYDPKHIINF